MEILCISHKYPPSIGGMQKHCFELVNGLRRDHQVHLLIPEKNENKIRFFISIKNRVRQILARHPGIELIYANDGLMAQACVGIKRITDVPIVATLHGLDVVFPNRLYKNVIIKRLNRLDHFVCVSAYTKEMAADRGLDPDRLSVINNGVDHLDTPADQPLDRLKFERLSGLELKDKKILVGVGRAVKRKGYSWFISRVLPKLSSRYVLLMAGPINPRKSAMRASLRWIPKGIRHQVDLFLGSSSDSEAIHRLLDIPSVRSRVAHLGRLSFEDLNQLYRLADLFIMPNIPVNGDSEGFGLVALEAVMRKTVVLASDLEGIRDAIQHEKNGFLSASGNEIQWSLMIQDLTAEDKSKNEFIDQAINYTKGHFGWKKMSKEYSQLFQNICSEKCTTARTSNLEVDNSAKLKKEGRLSYNL